MLRRVLSARWLLTTLLVLVAMGVMVRLGFWQLDRLEQRRAFNRRVLAQIDQPAITLGEATLQEDLANMEYRQIIVTGVYDHEHEVALRNQAVGGEWGVHLITPLQIEGAQAYILVDRGWIPADGYTSGDWSQYTEPGLMRVEGVIRRSQSRPDFGRRSDPTPAPGEGPLKAWNFVNVERIGGQTPYQMLPVYIQQAPDPAWTGQPVRTQAQVEITEGSHLGYAIQWFTFAAILGIGYPFFIHNQEQRDAKKNLQPVRSY